ncbi:type II toxin-antitoxin system VapC family toxin [Amaricoccus sp.]|uniref:type II toxin-antitoxin system VapC family toxin n=1 Tax=Amaricoccus sp. TaxID=1872485 RepID=UPI001B6CC0FC|nr:type II toxin-antitoxin system VapC family toxin [Amaricoccus sp.]MBP7001180.1 type II toxin-antitoxin system VapC family toxin [Amaricoccus sp.]
MARLLLDTHALLWWLDGDRRLSPRAREAITAESSQVVVSAASAWELTTKHRLGKLPAAADVARDVAGCLLAQGFGELPVTVGDAERAGRLPGPHADPFDRMLIAQALGGDLELISNETAFDAYGVRRLW